MSVAIRKIIVPPYCGIPRLSHQFPVTAVVVGVVVVTIAAVVVEVAVLVVVVVVVLVVAEIDVVDVFNVEQDDNSIAATRKKIKPNQINLFFNFVLLFYL
jgi:hypothetical protein